MLAMSEYATTLNNKAKIAYNKTAAEIDTANDNNKPTPLYARRTYSKALRPIATTVADRVLANEAKANL